MAFLAPRSVLTGWAIKLEYVSRVHLQDLQRNPQSLQESQRALHCSLQKLRDSYFYLGTGALSFLFLGRRHFHHRRNPGKRRCFFSCSECFSAWLTLSTESGRIYLPESFRRG